MDDFLRERSRFLRKNSLYVETAIREGGNPRPGESYKSWHRRREALCQAMCEPYMPPDPLDDALPPPDVWARLFLGSAPIVSDDHLKKRDH